MRKNCWFIFGAMLSTSLLAQQVTNPPPSAPIETPAAAPVVTNAAAPSAEVTTNAPAAQSGKKKKKKKAEKKGAVAKKKEAGSELATTPLLAGAATVVASNVNVRGKASLKGDIVTRVTKGQEVIVLQEIVRNDSGPEEPSAWAKILLPPNGHAWVSTGFIDASNQTVKPKKLNVRSGPGENFSVIAQLQRGDSVKELNTKGDWMEIDPPTNAYAFIAAQYLKQEAPGTASTNATEIAAKPAEAAPAAPASPATPAPVTEAPAVAPAPTEAPAMPATAETPAVTNTTEMAAASTNASEVAAASTNATEMAATTNATTEPVVQEPPPKRIVQREGFVRGTFSIQAPTHFELVSPETRETIDYLYTTSPNLDLRRYKGLRIVVTGEEGLEERWGNTPVITIQKIQVLE